MSKGKPISSTTGLLQPIPAKPSGLLTQLPTTVPHSEADVSWAARNAEKERVRNKFSDVIQVSDSCHEYGEFDIENARDDFSVAGRLSRPEHVKFFGKMGAHKFILDTLQHGHKPTLTAEVPNYERRNNNSYKEHKEFAVKEILKLIKDKKVEVVNHKPRIVNPLSVQVEPTKKRLILDCSFLNRYVACPSFKMEDYRTALSLMDSDGYIFSFDLKDGYHHLNIHPDFRDYLGFKFENNGQTIYVRYIVAPFGLRDVPYTFTKMLRPLVAHWRRCNIKICLYLDDGFASASTYDKALRDSCHVRQDLMRAGIVWNVKKSTWKPVQELDWVGYYWKTVSGTYHVRERRVKKLKGFLEELKALRGCTARKLAALVGQIISMQPVLGDIARLKTRNCQIAVAIAQHWEQKVTLGENIKGELEFWSGNIDRLNTKDCFQTDKPLEVDLVESDASGSGCGSILNGEAIAARNFEKIEREQSSTFREIACIHFSLASFLPRIKNRTVTLRTDSQAAAKICRIGSMNSVLQHFAESIFEMCFKNKITLTVDWIPRELNKQADEVSRLPDRVDIDDWQITNELFKIIDAKWGPITIDLFANYYNAKCQRYYSLFYSPGTKGVDAFTYDWEGENALMVPPVNKVTHALSHAFLCKIKCTLVVPLWTSSSFWPVLVNNYSGYIIDYLQVKGQKVLKQGRNPNSIFGTNSFQGDILAIHLDFS